MMRLHFLLLMMMASFLWSQNMAYSTDSSVYVDGTIAEGGCGILNGTIIDTHGIQNEPLRLCKAGDRQFKIVYFYACEDMIYDAKDPDTGISYVFPTPCGVPVSCVSDYDWNTKSGRDHFDKLPVDIGGKLFTITTGSNDGICTFLAFFPDEKKISMISKGVWEDKTTISVNIPKELLEGEFTVTVDENKINPQISEFSDYCEPYVPNCRVLYSRIDIQLDSLQDERMIEIIGTQAILGSQKIVLTPRQQMINGVLPEDVVCYGDLVLIKKLSKDTVACVKPLTAEKLVQRGWGVQISDVPKQNISKAVSMTISPEKTVYKIGEPISITIRNIGTERLVFPDAAHGIGIRNPDNVATCCVAPSVETTLEPNQAFTYDWIITDWNNTPPKTGTYRIHVVYGTEELGITDGISQYIQVEKE